ncbi:MAG: hypothetical protein GW907_12345 [Betaproteobacteria bacterium]|nr:hypothetical protein [Betaproteobacteria bacterium]NCP82996.1 hypothetical protein [Rhodoferax sp.]NCS62064.1 hypothetical protein [Rhodoferax sp.]
MHSKHPSWIRFWVVTLGIAATSAPAVAAINCSEQSRFLQYAYVNNTSNWQEFDSTGRELVRESGKLTGPQLSAALTCSGWRLQAEVTQLDGDRRYDGQTSSGVNVLSSSALHRIDRQLQASVNVTKDLQVGLRVSNHRTWRDIASAGGASGYPERFEWTLLSVGSQWSKPVSFGQLTLGAWVGTQLDSSMTLNLPGRDQTTLLLGKIHQVELQLGWEVPVTPSWSLHANVRYRKIEVSQGADGIVTKNGFPVGVAHQPQTRLVDIPVTVSLSYRF